MEENSEGPTTLNAFYAQLAETHEAPLQYVSRIRTKAADISKYSYRESRIYFKENMQQYESLQVAQYYPGTILTFGAQSVNTANPKPEDDIYKALEAAGLDFAAKQRPERQTNFTDDSESDDLGLDFNYFYSNKQRIGKQTGDIIRLRMLLKYNESKLRRWAKIKSKNFRRIHNKERRAEKMQRIYDKLTIGIEAAEQAGLQELAQDLARDQQDFLNGVYNGGAGKAQLEAEARPADYYQDGQSALSRLYFIYNAVGQRDYNVLLQKAHKHFGGTQIDYEQQADAVAEALVFNAEYDKPYIIPAEVEQARITLAHYIEEVQEDDQQQEIMGAMFPEQNEIDYLKRSEINVQTQEVLPGWGEWTGAGASAWDYYKLQRKVYSAEMQRKYLEQQQWDARTDLEKNAVFETMNVNYDVYDKYSARKLDISDEQYEQYLKQSLLPEYQTIANRMYQIYNSVKVVRGQKILQERELEANAKQLEKLSRQLERQKKLIKGQRVPGGPRKNHFQ